MANSMKSKRVGSAKTDTSNGAENTRFRGKKMFLIVLVLVLLLFPLLQVFFGGFNYYLQVALIIFMSVAMASSWNILGGYAGYISLGHNVFFGVGGYLAGALLVFYGVSPFLTAPLAGVASFLIGLVIGFITLRTRGTAFIISTIALLLLTRLVFQNWLLLGGTNGLSLPLLALPRTLLKLPFYYGMLITAAGAVYVSYKIAHSKFGLGLRAISQDETKTEFAGINTRVYKILAFAISAFFVGVAGTFWGYQLSYLRPIIFFDIAIAVNMVLMSYLGGKGTVAGPVLGAVFLVALNELSVTYLKASELNIALTGLVMVLVVLFFPQGIVGTLREHKRLPQILDWD